MTDPTTPRPAPSAGSWLNGGGPTPPRTGLESMPQPAPVRADGPAPSWLTPAFEAVEPPAATPEPAAWPLAPLNTPERARVEKQAPAPVFNAGPPRSPVFIPDDADLAAPSPVEPAEATDLPLFASAVRAPRPTLLARVAPLALVGAVLGIIGLVVAWVTTVHFVGFGVAVFGVLFAAAGFFARGRSRVLTGVAVAIAVLSVLGTLGHSTPSADTTAAAAVAATDATTVDLSVQGASGTTISGVRYTFDRADGLATETQHPPVLPWSKSVNVSTSRSDAGDSYAIHVTSTAGQKNGSAVCSITIGGTIVAMNIGQPGKPLLCRYVGPTKNAVPAGTAADLANLVKTLSGPAVPTGR